MLTHHLYALYFGKCKHGYCSKTCSDKKVNNIKHRSPAQVGCMRQVLGPDALGRPRGIRCSGWWEGGLGWVILGYPWLIHVNVWQKPLQYCKVISLQLIKKIIIIKYKKIFLKKKVNNIKQTQANEVHSSSIFIFKVSFASNFLCLRNKEQYTKEAFYFPKVIPWTILM